MIMIIISVNTGGYIMKKYFMIGSAALLSLTLVACGDKSADKEQEDTTTNTEQVTENETTKNETAQDNTQIVTYLGEQYELPAKINNILAGSFEAMEDSVALGVQPVGVIDMERVPEYLKDMASKAEPVGDKFGPSPEAAMTIKPDVIIGTSKWQPDVVEKLNKVQTVIPYSHIAKDWKENLRFYGQIVGKEDKANELISDYEKQVEKVQATAKEKLADQNVLIIRYRQGLYVYPQDVYLNDILYNDLGAPVPQVVKDAPSQIELSMESLSELNPDVIFLQIQVNDESEANKIADDFKNDPIVQNLNAIKNDNVFINAIDPLAEGGTALSKKMFLDIASEKLLK